MTVLATAGHVDHGKSTFVTFLTEQETDRLPEEKKRGLTINLGYTFFNHKNETYSINVQQFTAEVTRAFARMSMKPEDCNRRDVRPQRAH